MSNVPRRPFSPRVQAVIDEFVPMLRRWQSEVGQYAIAIGGSQGKDTWDERSDVDFRFFYERPLPSEAARPDLWSELNGAIERWQANGVTIDGVWPRQIREIDAALDRWLKSELCPNDYVWTIWGYHLLPDIYHQVILDDPYQVIANWKARLHPYPPQLKQAILDKHWSSLQYWRHDYHYHNKAKRGDVVFLAGLSARLVHDMLQVLFALNETYFVGDGQNLKFAAAFTIAPPNFAARVQAALYPEHSASMFEQQREQLCTLIDEVGACLSTKHTT